MMKLYPNPDIENTMLTQVLDAPRKSIKSLITNKVVTVFMIFLCTSITCTIKRISISGFGLYKKIVVVLLITSYTCVFARMDWDELNHEQQKILLPFESSWSSLDDNAKDKLLVNTNKWLDMTPMQRTQSRKKLNRFKSLSKEEREKFQQRFKHLKNLSPQERRQLERAKRKFQQLNPKEKARLRKKYNQTPPAHRKKAILRFNRQQKEKEFISRFDIDKRRPIVEMFKSLEKADRIKFRKSMKNMSPKQRHEQVLLLLSVQPDKRGGYIQGLKQ